MQISDFYKEVSQLSKDNSYLVDNEAKLGLELIRKEITEAAQKGQHYVEVLIDNEVVIDRLFPHYCYVLNMEGFHASWAARPGYLYVRWK